MQKAEAAPSWIDGDVAYTRGLFVLAIQEQGYAASVYASDAYSVAVKKPEHSPIVCTFIAFYREDATHQRPMCGALAIAIEKDFAQLQLRLVLIVVPSHGYPRLRRFAVSTVGSATSAWRVRQWFRAIEDDDGQACRFCASTNH